MSEPEAPEHDLSEQELRDLQVLRVANKSLRILRGIHKEGFRPPERTQWGTPDTPPKPESPRLPPNTTDEDILRAVANEPPAEIQPPLYRYVLPK